MGKATPCFPPIPQVGIPAHPGRVSLQHRSAGDASSEAGGHVATVMPYWVQAEKQVVFAGGGQGGHKTSCPAPDVLYIPEIALYGWRYLVPLHGAVPRRDKSAPAARMPIKHLTMGRRRDQG